MTNIFWTVCLGVFLASLSFASSSDLDAVVVVYRHGDRTPIRPYPTDPYGNRSYWPVDWGMMTNLGKTRHYKLGQYFRQRYIDFLPAIYSEKDIYVRSTDVDRTLMSAESNLAGLYPPINSDVWNPNIAWQPIPIHSIPEELDAVLASKKPCKKYKYLQKKLFESPLFKNISHKNHDLYAYLTRYSGETISSIKALEYLYNTFQIETWNNLTIPDWAQKVFPSKMQEWAQLSFATMTYTPEMARLKTGLFFNDLVQYFTNRTVTPQGAQFNAPKFLMFSAHDTTVANLLNSMGVFEYHCPPYTATIIFELHKPTPNTSYVNIFYKNTSEARPIKLPACDINCEFKRFQDILAPLILTEDQWEAECNSLLYIDNLNLYLIIGTLMVSLFCICVIGFVAKKRASRADISMYSQLPDEEYA